MMSIATKTPIQQLAHVIQHLGQNRLREFMNLHSFTVSTWDLFHPTYHMEMIHLMKHGASDINS